jgi:hypothetical protein
MDGGSYILQRPAALLKDELTGKSLEDTTPKRIEELKLLLAAFDSEDLLVAVGALGLMPENASHFYRLQDRPLPNRENER